MNKFFVEEPKNMIINLIISFVVILATVAFAGLSGSDLVIQTAWYILIIHWMYGSGRHFLKMALVMI